MRKDIWKFSIILFIAGIFGLTIGYPVLIMLVAALGIITWTIYRIELLRRWLVSPKKFPYPDSSGQFFALHRLINQRNIKNRKRKRKLTNYLKQFRNAASALPDAIVLIDKHGKISWANSNTSNVFGIQWPNDDGVKFIDLIRDPKVTALFNKNINDNKTTNKKKSAQEVEFTPKLNSQATISIRVTQYTDDLRMIIGRDISRHLIVSQMQSDFVANVSHELKTPLTVLKGYLEIIQNRSDLSPELSKVFAQMQTQSERMELIVGDLLYLAKLENRDNQSAHNTVDITNIINTVIETIDEKLTKKKLKLELNIDYKLTVQGSSSELHAAFSNLIFNAVNYTPKQGVIKVSWQKSKDGPCFSVRDNGEGISQNHIPRLTQRFYRIDSDRSRDGGGTGLGLAIVKHVLQRHNAILQIDSDVGIGSEFTCIFPIKKNLLEDQQNLAN